MGGHRSFGPLSPHLDPGAQLRHPLHGGVGVSADVAPLPHLDRGPWAQRPLASRDRGRAGGCGALGSRRFYRNRGPELTARSPGDRRVWRHHHRPPNGGPSGSARSTSAVGELDRGPDGAGGGRGRADPAPEQRGPPPEWSDLRLGGPIGHRRLGRRALCRGLRRLIGAGPRRRGSCPGAERPRRREDLRAPGRLGLEDDQRGGGRPEPGAHRRRQPHRDHRQPLLGVHRGGGWC
jgi:hypothetical protein